MTARRGHAAFLYRLGATAIQSVPPSVASGIGDLVGRAVGIVRARSSPVLRANLARVLATAPAQVPADLLVRSYESYTRYWVDNALLPAVGVARIDSRCTVSGNEHLEAAMRGGRGAILALPHIGTFEAGGLWLAAHGFPMTTVAERLEPPALFEWMVSARAETGLRVLPADSAATSAELLRTLRAGGLVGLLTDRDVLGNGVEVEFFGERTRLPAGPALLALRSGAPLMTTAVYDEPGHRNHIVLNPPIDCARRGRLGEDISRITQVVTHELEQLIRAAPEQWHVLQPNWPADVHLAAVSRPGA